MNTPAVSVLLPVRNAEATVGHALESLARQTWGDIEIVAVNDGSTDGTGALLKEWAERETRLRVVEGPRPGGLVAALQLAHREARGRFLARMDADDVCSPQRYEKQMAFLQARPDVAACGCLVRITGSQKGEGFERYEAWINSLTQPEEIAAERFVESPLVHPSVVMRREAFEAVGGYRDCRWAEDYDLWLRFLEAGCRLAKAPEVLLEWRDEPSRLTRTDGRYSRENFLRAKAHYLSRLEAVRERGVVISGAGPTGKQLARFLREEGTEVKAFLDVHPRRIGRKVQGIPVLDAREVETAGEGSPVQLGAVGQPGRREVVARLFEEKGYRRGVSFFAVA